MTLHHANHVHRMPKGEPCSHPVTSLRYDGLQPMAEGGYMASVTCTEPGCYTSRLIPIREDEHARLLNGGSRADQGHGGPEGSSVRMAPRNGGTP